MGKTTQAASSLKKTYRCRSVQEMVRMCGIRELQAQTRRDHYAPVTMAHIQNTDNTECWQGCGQQKLSCIAGNVKWYSHLARHFSIFWNKAIPLSYDPAMMLLGIYHQELKTTWTQKTAYECLLIIANTWKQLACPPVGEWISKLWDIQWNIIQH